MNNKNNFSSCKIPILLFVATRLWIFAVTCLIYGFWGCELPQTSPVWHGGLQKENIFLEPWRRWDALWFLQVVREGYHYRPDAQSNITIFPLYPFLIKIIAGIIGNQVLTGLIISNLCLLLLCVLLYRLTSEKLGGVAAFWGVLFLLLFPTGFLLSGVYSESLLIMLAVATFLSARRRVWWLCGVTGMLAGATRLTGLILFPAMVLEYLSQKRFRLRECHRDFFFLFLMPIGGLTYFLYLYKLTGDFFAYFEAQKHWGHHLTSPIFSFFYEAAMDLNFTVALDLTSAVIFIILSILVFRRLGAAYGFYSLAVVLVAMSATKLFGLPRYVLAAFPAFMVLGELIRWKPLRWALALALAALQVYCMYNFINWKISF
ncbi:MAG: glycosyltransferase family 39 protein [bacterium]